MFCQTAKIPDSLVDKEYRYFREILDDDALAPNVQQLYAQSYLAMAKSHKDWPEIMEAYKSVMHLYKGERRLAYCDSMIYAARKAKRQDLLGSAYLTKGIMYYGVKRHREALENYLLAEPFISKTNNQYLIHKLKFSLAETNYYLGYFNTAVPLFKDCVDFYGKSGGKPWLSSMHHLGLCYTKLKKYELCSALNELGLREAIKADEQDMTLYFTHAEGVNQYYRKNYELSKNKLIQSVPGLIERGDMPNEMVAYFYIGKCFWDMNQRGSALPYFLKIDQALITHHYVRRDLREGVSLLIDYYASQNDSDLELRYSRHLRKADSILSNNFEILSNKVHARQYKENDRRIERLEADRQYKDKQIWSLSSAAGIGLLTAMFFVRRNRILKRQFRQHYEAFVENGNVSPIKAIERPKLTETIITPKDEEKLLENLVGFEDSKKYLRRDMGKTNIAKELDSNPTYTMHIISKHRGKGIVKYINDLKCEHAYELLTHDKNFRHFDQKSQAQEIGFATAQHYRRAFIHRYGFSPRFYIDRLENEGNESAANEC